MDSIQPFSGRYTTVETHLETIFTIQAGISCPNHQVADPKSLVHNSSLVLRYKG